ncbi:DDE-type integrase/transposase/recombinase [Serratia nematodiphila]|nr:DDE-type integrase/transposase/recombinase [Serratia nematodiphila]
MPPNVIVPTLADKGVYIASESTFYRVLKSANQLTRRSRECQYQRPDVLKAVAPNQVWSWDISYLPSWVRGQHFYLYMIIDIYSRKIIAAEVFTSESGKHAAELLQRAVWSEKSASSNLVLHSDNGGPMRSYTLLAKMYALGVLSSYSRPRVSNDNPYSESLFRTLKYCPWWPENGFRTIDDARAWVTPGVDGVNKAKLQARLAAELQILRDELVSGHYQPLPARRVYIPKSNGKLRPLGIPALRDRIVQRAMLMAMEPIWESDFHTLSYGFRPERSVNHAIRTVKLQLTDCGETRGRWVIEGDLSSYFDTVHHRLLMKAVRRRISDARFMTLLWKTIKAGHIGVGLFRAASEGVPQGGVISPLLSNISKRKPSAVCSH